MDREYQQIRKNLQIYKILMNAHRHRDKAVPPGWSPREGRWRPSRGDEAEM